MYIDKKRTYYLFIVLIICCWQLFASVYHKDLMEWDESRNGVNAYEMLQRGDYINLYYGNELDTWNAKPPLVFWGIMAGYKIFGYNEVALRLTSALSALLFFIILFNLVEKYQNALRAFFCCIILLSCKAMIGFHAGINGDFDAVLSLFLLLSASYFLQYIHSGNSYNLYAVAIFTGLAFYTKGTAGFLFLPGLLLYTIAQGKFRDLFKNKHTWLAVLVFICITASWFIIGIFYCQTPSHSAFGTKNPIETMLVHDTFMRLTSNNYKYAHGHDLLSFIKTLDVRFNIWNYLFYLSIGTGLFLLFKNRSRLVKYIQQDSNRLVVFSVCIAAPIAITLNFAVNMHDWYFTPIWGFVAIIMVTGYSYLASMQKTALYVFIIISLFTCIRHIIYLHSLPEELHNTFTRKNDVFAKEKYVIVADNPKQNLMLYLHWMQMDFKKITNNTLLPAERKGKILIIEKNQLDQYQSTLHIESIQETGMYVIARIL